MLPYLLYFRSRKQKSNAVMDNIAFVIKLKLFTVLPAVH